MDKWWELLKEIAVLHPTIEFDLAIYENDSQDTTKNLIGLCLPRAEATALFEFHPANRVLWRGS